MSSPIVLDLETKYSFQDVNHDLKKLGVSVVGTYSYADERYQCFREDDFPRLFQLLESASLIVGFNIKKFDFLVLSPYYLGNINKLPTLDLLESIDETLGFRVSLDDLARETLGERKNGHGFLAIEYFRSGEWDKLLEYCLHDVRLTQRLYEYGRDNGQVFFKSPYGRRAIKVAWNQKIDKNDIPLTLPF
ncbi:ribonuclease H-like domain-containing protein [Candidatus Woesebacteria bacterium]|nr:ribonuclease H-like domain-containing protein [Candidatus Woesebacteria bacterium]